MTRKLGLTVALVGLLILGSVLPSFAETEGVYGPFGFGLGKGFTEFTFAHTGDGSDVSIELGFAPGNALAQQGLALKLFAPDGTVAATGEASFGLATIEVAPAVAGTYTIEVANYHENLPLECSLVVRGDGVSDVAAVEAAAEDVEAVEEPAVVEEVEEPEVAEEPAEDAAPAEPAPANVFGPLGLGLGKGFAEFTFAHTGDGSDVSIELGFAPGNALAQQGLALKLFAPDGTVAATGEASFGLATIEVAPAVAGTYTIEVANYHENLPLECSLVVRGDGVSDIAAVEAAAEDVEAVEEPAVVEEVEEPEVAE